MTSDLREQLQSTLGTAYTLERELGGGGMSRVSLAEETRLHSRRVALGDWHVTLDDHRATLHGDHFTRGDRLHGIHRSLFYLTNA